MANLLVIGGTGFFGKSILDGFQRGLLDHWDIVKIYIISRNPEALLLDAPELMNQDVVLVKGDLSEIKELPITEYIIHAAASSDARKYFEDSEAESKNIFSATKNFCNIIRNSPNYKKSKILFISSGAVYGKNSDPLIKFQETDYLKPTSDLAMNKIKYAETKISSEKMMEELFNDGFSVTVARCFAFTGKYLPKNQHFAIGNFIGDAIHGKRIQILARHAVFRSYLHSDDLTVWLMTIADSSCKNFQIFNVGSDCGIEIHVLGEMIAKEFNVDIEMVGINSNLPKDVYLPNIDKAKNKLGLRISIDLLESIRRSF